MVSSQTVAPPAARLLLAVTVLASCASLGASQGAAAPVEAVATFSGAVTGTISFSQDPAGGSTTLLLNLAGLEEGADNAYHVHELPMLASGSCGARSVGGHWNPTGVPEPALCPVDPANCEVGDLSGKHGVLPGKTAQGVFSDSELPLLGAHSIVGRSIVIHAADGSRMACADILPANAGVTTAVATFSSPEVSGTVSLTQAEGGHTSVLVDLAGAQTSEGHNWHVHVDPVPADGSCAGAGGHYDPAGVGTATCALAATPEAKASGCEVGDLSGKHGATALPRRALFTDAALPLSGERSVAARSIVVHGPSGAAERLACASLVATQAPSGDADNLGNSYGDDSDDSDGDGGLGMAAIVAISAVCGVAALVAVALAVKFSRERVTEGPGPRVGKNAAAAHAKATLLDAAGPPPSGTSAPPTDEGRAPGGNAHLPTANAV